MVVLRKFNYDKDRRMMPEVAAQFFIIIAFAESAEDEVSTKEKIKDAPQLLSSSNSLKEFFPSRNQLQDFATRVKSGKKVSPHLAQTDASQRENQIVWSRQNTAGQQAAAEAQSAKKRMTGTGFGLRVEVCVLPQIIIINFCLPPITPLPVLMSLASTHHGKTL
jgi:hypothetical protein